MALSSMCPKGQNGLVKNWIKMNKDEYSKMPVDVKSQTTKSKLAVGDKNTKKCVACGPAIPLVGICLES